MLIDPQGGKIMVEWKLTSFDIDYLISQTPVVKQCSKYWDPSVKTVILYHINGGVYRDITKLVESYLKIDSYKPSTGDINACRITSKD